MQHLVAAGTLHATENKADPSHVQNITEKWESMAAVTNNEELLRKLAFGDVTSNELFYHKNCYQAFRNLYRGRQREIDRLKLEDTEEWTKSSVLSKIVSYIYEIEKEVPGSVFGDYVYRVTEVSYYPDNHSRKFQFLPRPKYFWCCFT